MPSWPPTGPPARSSRPGRRSPATRSSTCRAPRPRSGAAGHARPEPQDAGARRPRHRPRRLRRLHAGRQARAPVPLRRRHGRRRLSQGPGQGARRGDQPRGADLGDVGRRLGRRGRRHPLPTRPSRGSSRSSTSSPTRRSIYRVSGDGRLGPLDLLVYQVPNAKGPIQPPGIYYGRHAPRALGDPSPSSRSRTRSSP